MRSRKPLIFRELRRAIRDDAVGHERTLAELIRDGLTFPLRFFVAFLQFMAVAWPTSRNGYAFVRGLPALIVIGLFGIGVWASYYFVNLNKLVKRSQTKIAFFQMNSPDEPGYAEIFAKRFVELRPDDAEAKYQLAVCLENSGKEYLSDQLFDLLVTHEDANLNGVLDEGEDLNEDGELNLGYGRAHVRVGQRFLRATDEDYPELSKEERLQKAAEEFQLAIRTEDEDTVVIALALLADVNILRDDPDAAIENLNQMLSGPMKSLVQIRSIPRRLKLQLEQVERRREGLSSLEVAKRQQEEKLLKRTESAILTTTRNVIDRSRILGRRTKLFEVWRTLVACAQLIEDFNLAFNLIQSAADDADNDELRNSLLRLRSQVHLAKAETFENLEDESKFKAHYREVLQAAKTDQANAEPFRRIISLVGEATADQENWFRALQIDSQIPREVFEIALGLFEIKNGEFEIAKRHWKTALRISESKSPLIITTFIETKLSLEKRDKTELANILALASELMPEYPRLLYVDAVFQLRQRKVEEAKGLLEKAVTRMPDFLPIRLALKEAYLASGDTENATVQEQEFERILSNFPPARAARLRLLYSREFIFPDEQ